MLGHHTLISLPLADLRAPCSTFSQDLINILRHCKIAHQIKVPSPEPELLRWRHQEPVSCGPLVQGNYRV